MSKQGLVISIPNPEHVAMVLRGVDPILELRTKLWDKGKILDLAGANLKNTDFSGAEFYKAKLAGASLFHANLFEAIFSQSNFSRADLSWSDLCYADLSQANLMNAKLRNANLTSANLSEADLSGADLSFANLTAANLLEANLSNSNLYATNFFFTEVGKVNFTNAIMNTTLISACDLSKCMNLETVKHTGPSLVGLDTLAQSFYNSGNHFTSPFESFFLNSGIPRKLLRSLKRTLAKTGYRADH